MTLMMLPILEDLFPSNDLLLNDEGCLSPSTFSLTPSSAPFPCLADELELQAKALTEDIFLPSPLQQQQQSLAQSPSPLKALKVSTYDPTLQRRMIPVHGRAEGEDPAFFTNSPAPPREDGLTMAHSRPGSAAGMRYHAPLLHHQSLHAPHSAPLAAALHNADCVRLNLLSLWQGAWIGCRRAPWCNHKRGHLGPCNTQASIPGLAAYLPEELAAVGLAGVVELMTDLPPRAAMLAARAAEEAALMAGNALPLPPSGLKGALHAGREIDESDSGLTASDNNSGNNGDEAVDQHQLPMRASRNKRKKAAAAAMTAAGDDAITDNETASDELKSTTTTLEVMMHAHQHRKQHRKSHKPYARALTKKQKQKRRHHDHAIHHRASAPIMRGIPIDPAAVAAAVANTGKAGAPRPTSRKVQQWITTETRDPRSGEMVTMVPPATFCTQCGATHTPVWRAGPFGHKTLCNACGVRWMKVAPKVHRK